MKNKTQNLFRNTLRTFGFIYERAPVLTITLLTSSIVVASIGYLQLGSFGAIVNEIQTNLQNGKTVLTSHSVLLLFIVVFVPFIQSLVGIIDRFLDTKINFRMLRELTLYFNEKVSKLDIATFQSSEFQDKMSIVRERGLNASYPFFSFSISNLANIVAVVISIFILYAINPTLVLLAVIGSVPGLIIETKYGNEIWGILQLNAEARRRFHMFENKFQNKYGLSEIKLLDLSKTFLGKIKALLSVFDDEVEKAEKKRVISGIISTIIFSLFYGLAIYILVKDGINGIIPIGTLVFAYTTFRAFQAGLGSFFQTLARQIEFNNYVNAFWEVIDLKPKISSKKNAKLVKFETPPNIEFRNVTFHYPNSKKEILKDLSFTIFSGQKIGIVGLNGAGKTTLVNVFARIYDPTNGDIYLDGINLKNIDTESWFNSIAYMPQSVMTYQGLSIAESIALGDVSKKLNMQRIIDAAQKSTASNFIDELDGKYESIIGREFKNGEELSFGQSQKLVIAKILYRNAPILILDEPTSSVDALSQEIIYKNLEEHTEGKTVIMISHNFSTIKNADVIMLIEDGKIIEKGTHEELIASGGKYMELYDKQAASYVDEKIEE